MADVSSAQIAIPSDTRILGEFIAGLLGQRRSIERTFYDRRFEIDMNWLLNLDQIIAQRLAAQNTAKLVSFSAKFYFANGKVITLEAQTESVPKWKLGLRSVRSVLLFPITLLVGIFVMMWSLEGALSISGDNFLKKFGPIAEIQNHLTGNEQKIDFLVSATQARLMTDIPLLMPIARAVGVYIVLTGLFFILLIRKASFISINEYSKRYLEKYGKNYEFIKYGVGAALMVGIAAGLFSDRIYEVVRPLL